MEVICTDNSLTVKRNDMTIFEITLSQNNLVRILRIGKVICCHSFDEDYDYEHEELKDWETHGKLCSEKLQNVVDNYDTSYEFYYSDELTANFIHNKDNSFEITYNSWEFNDVINDSCKFTCEEFSLFKNSLKNLISS